MFHVKHFVRGCVKAGHTEYLVRCAKYGETVSGRHMHPALLVCDPLPASPWEGEGSTSPMCRVG